MVEPTVPYRAAAASGDGRIGELRLAVLDIAQLITLGDGLNKGPALAPAVA